MVDLELSFSQQSTLNISDPIPDNLAEFGELPNGFVSVFTTVSRESLASVSEHGLAVRFNQMGQQAPLEALFEEEATERGITVKRTACVFAYPSHPDSLKESLSFNPEDDLLLEIKVDPKQCLVADGSTFGEASSMYQGLESFPRSRSVRQNTLESIRTIADQYWQSSLWLSEYNKLNYRNRPFRMPEVLIPYNVSVDCIRTAPLQPKASILYRD